MREVVCILHKIRWWLDKTNLLRYHLFPVLLFPVIFYFLKKYSVQYQGITSIMVACIPAGWHTFNYIKHVLTYRPKDAAERVIDYLESRRNFSLTIHLIKWFIKGVVSFIIGVPALLYLLYKIFQEFKRLKNEKRQEINHLGI